jgi:hypothetical protein
VKWLPLLLLFPVFASAQIGFNVRDSSLNGNLLLFSYSQQFPAADLADRFSTNSNVGFAFLRKWKAWQFGAETNWLFGENVKEDSMLRHLVSSTGNPISTDGLFEDFVFQQRGLHFSLRSGYLLPVLNSNANSGIWFSFGVGFLAHKIRLQVDERKVPFLNKDYKKGYDRLTSGLATDLFIGYMQLSSRKLINFYAGIQCIQGFTAGRRTWNYDTNEPGTASRFDLLWGIKAGWIIPAYQRKASDFYYR